MYHCLVVLYQDCSNYAPGVKIGHALGVVWFYIGIYRENVNNCFKRHLLLNHLANLMKLHRDVPWVVPFQNC